MENAFEAIVKLLKLEFVLNLNFAVKWSPSGWSCTQLAEKCSIEKQLTFTANSEQV